jgi:hypothetical protein
LQAQADFAQFQAVFTDEPDVPWIVWLFSLVLGYSRLIWKCPLNLLSVLSWREGRRPWDVHRHRHL